MAQREVALTSNELDQWMDGSIDMPYNMSEAFEDALDDIREAGETIIITIKVTK